MTSDRRPRIVIIGAGVAGMSTALRAAELGCTDVKVLERRFPASGSSGLSAGVFNVNGTDPLMIRVRARTREMLALLEKENNLLLSRIGHLRLGRNERHVKLFEEIVGWQVEEGVEPAQLLGPDEIREIVPHLRLDDVEVGLWSPLDGHMDGPLLCAALAERAQPLGIELFTKHPVTAYRKDGAEHVLTTPNDEFRADVVVNAAGPWADRIGEMLGAPLPLVNQVHDVIKVKLPSEIDYTVPMVQEYIPGDEVAIYFRQDGPDTLICGEHTYSVVGEPVSENPDDYRKTVPWDVWERVAERVSERFRVEGLGFEPGWTGLYPIPPDGELVFGPYEHDNTIIAAGGGGAHGLTAGVSLGRVAAEYAVGEEPQTVTGCEAFLPDRESLGAARAS